jgi:hypothetical protein
MKKDFLELSFICTLLGTYNLAYIEVNQDALVKLLEEATRISEKYIEFRVTEDCFGGGNFACIPFNAKVILLDNGNVSYFTDINKFKVYCFDRFLENNLSLPKKIEI